MYLYVSLCILCFRYKQISAYVARAELFFLVTKRFLEKQDQGSPDHLIKDLVFPGNRYQEYYSHLGSLGNKSDCLS